MINDNESFIKLLNDMLVEHQKKLQNPEYFDIYLEYIINEFMKENKMFKVSF